MARHQRRPRRNPPIAPPKFSLTVLTWLMIGFFVLIGCFFIMPHGNNNKTMSSDNTAISSSNTMEGNTKLYKSPQEVPATVIQSLDAILVLGGGVPTSIDHPPIYVERRCDDAIQIYQRKQELPSLKQSKKRSNQRELETTSDDENNLSILCLSAGTAHVPQLLGHDGLPIWESTACSSYLAGKNIPSSSIYVETTSYDTIGNAYFTRTTHTDINGWRNLLIITNEFHMDRTRIIFDWIFGLDHNDNKTTKKKTKIMTSNPYQLYYLESPNVGLSEEAIVARREREKASSTMIQEKLIPQYTILRDVYYFLTHDHALYTAHKLVDRGRNKQENSEASEQVKKSYGGGNEKG